MTAVTITQITYQELELLIDSSIRKIMNKHIAHLNNEPALHTVKLNWNSFTQEEIDTINTLKLHQSPAKIDFLEDGLLKDPLKHFNGKTKKAIVEIIKKFKTVAFSGYDIIEIKKKYYVPDIQDTFKRLEKRGFCTIENVSHNHKVYQFSEKLCRHYGN